MPTAAFIQLRDGRTICTSTVLRLYLIGDAITFEMTDGQHTIDQWPVGQGAAQYVNYLNQLGVTGSGGNVTFTSITPNSVAQNLWTKAPVNFVFTGTNFPNDAAIGTGAGGLTFNDILVSPTLIVGSWGGGDFALGTWDVNVYNGGGTLATIVNGLVVTAAI